LLYLITMGFPQNSISHLSPHLFWDVDADNVNFDTSKKLIIERVLEYGLIKDWNLIVAVYGLLEIEKTAKQLKSLDPVTLSFLSTIFNSPKESFTCYKNKQSTQHYLGY